MQDQAMTILNPQLWTDVADFAKSHPFLTGTLATWFASDHVMSSTNKVKANNTLQLIWHIVTGAAKLVLKLNELRKSSGKDG
jgi:hypothetical protein